MLFLVTDDVRLSLFINDIMIKSKPMQLKNYTDIHKYSNDVTRKWCNSSINDQFLELQMVVTQTVVTDIEN